jgi:triosephosphate isomerase (TIM)
VIAANWKMNKTNAEAEVFLGAFLPGAADADAEIVICAPFTAL